MSRHLGQMWVVVVVAAACQAHLSMAQETFLWASDESPSAAEKSLAGDNAGCAKAGPCAACNACESCDRSLPLGCAKCPSYSIIGSLGMDSFHGNSDSYGGSDSSNFGAVAGLNFAMPVVRDYGIGWQLGATYGVYDFDGRASYKTAESQQQIFVTTGLYHRACGGQRLSYGVVYDWMLNNNWGLFATAPTLGQWRGEIEYALSNSNAVGVYASQRDLSSQQTIPILQRTATVSTRAVSQVDLFWHHKFDCGADSRLWFGIPDHGRYPVGLVQEGSLYDWIIGAQAEVPLSERLALYAAAQYVHPSASAGATASQEQSYDISAGVVWYLGGHARKSSINGACWEPYLPVANNSTFLVEQGTAIP